MSRLSAWLSAFALLAMALVPTGFMPAFGASGPSLVLCPSYGSAPSFDHAGMDHAAMGHGDMEDGASDSFAKSKDCSLGAAAPAALLPPPALRIAEKTLREEAFRPRLISVAQQTRRLRPPSRAPPVA